MFQWKEPGFICLREKDEQGENSNILKYAGEATKVREGGSGLQQSNQKLNWVAQRIDTQI